MITSDTIFKILSDMTNAQTLSMDQLVGAITMARLVNECLLLGKDLDDLPHRDYLHFPLSRTTENDAGIITTRSSITISQHARIEALLMSADEKRAKIDAIKWLRTECGCSLVEARDLVCAIQQALKHKKQLIEEKLP